MRPFFVSFACVLNACAAARPPIVAQGDVGLDRVAGPVDSELARYYVEHYVPRSATDAAIDRRIDELLAPVDRAPLSTRALTDLARATSNDFAALYFAERMTRDHRDLKERFLAYGAASTVPVLAPKPVVVVFVPGLFYQTHPETKGDLRDAELLVRAMGVATERVATDEAGTVEENAQRIADYIAERPDDGRQIVLVSASKGGPEVLYALGKLATAAATERVRAWVSIGGVLRGSPVADQHLSAPHSWLVGIVGWWVGFSCDMVESLSVERSLARFVSVAFPPHITVLHYVGVPLSGTVTEPVREPYDYMRPFGPSDGLTLLTDELLEGGHVITDLGLDHRYTDPRIEAKTAALTRLVLELIEAPSPGVCGGGDRRVTSTAPSTR